MQVYRFLNCNGVCYRCNISIECPLGDDEKECAVCEATEFQCHNERCIPYEWVCDDVNDCGDESDEAESVCRIMVTTEGKH
jgi:hypothetical protein